MTLRRLLVAALFCLVPTVVSAAEFSLEKTAEGYKILIDGKLFTEYVPLSGNKPILWPIIGPTGQPMTRAYPMADVEGDKKDHPHHRSFWFAHMEVNGWNYWAEQASYGAASKTRSEAVSKLGLTKHKEFKKVEAASDHVSLTVTNDWLAPDGKKVLEDERRIKFFVDGNSRVIDFDIDLKATEGPVEWGDNKDGVFGVRVPTSMDVTSKLGGKIVNSEGLTDEGAWGKPAKWCDYFGPVGKETLGIAILNHPSSFRYPTHWHVRTYGLFTANCFGLNDFDKSAGVNGTHTQAAGDTLKFRYRVIFHVGGPEEAKLEAAFQRYAQEAK